MTIRTDATYTARQLAGDAPNERGCSTAHRPVCVQMTREQARRLWMHAHGLESLPDSDLRALLRYVLPGMVS